MKTFVESEKVYKRSYFQSMMESFQQKEVYSHGGLHISKHYSYTVWKKGKYGPIVIARRETFAEAKGELESIHASRIA